ncbi:MAG TPA: hypothetical protein VKU60_03150 [Chloroflexota bacterium]|nr:hypothetical protein [Chloroflexota bacterium]
MIEKGAGRVGALPSPSARSARLAAQHVWYEWWMLQETAKALSVNVEAPWLKNAILESFAVHARALFYFLRTPLAARQHPSDVLAVDYFVPAYSWAFPREPLPEALTPVQRRANSAVAHLSYRRITAPSDGWHHEAIAEELSSLMRRFVADATPHGRLDEDLDWARLTNPNQR